LRIEFKIEDRDSERKVENSVRDKELKIRPRSKNVVVI
jgi:hypothetical protein